MRADRAAATGSPSTWTPCPWTTRPSTGCWPTGDTIGCFQVESRAQSSMLPRLKPQRFEDLIIEVAIVRPGPIQGGMVHPYLRRRQGLEPVTYLHPSLEPALRETLGVVIFQEQVLRVAMALAGFTPGEADLLRRAMSRSRSAEAMAALRERFLAGAQANGVEPAVAEEVFSQLQGFATYGFCKSHAASFALIAYQTLWLKAHYPAEFYCALLNHQPMGFYSPEVVIGDAKRHGITVLRPDVNASADGCTLEQGSGGAGAQGAGETGAESPCSPLPCSPCSRAPSRPALPRRPGRGGAGAAAGGAGQAALSRSGRLLPAHAAAAAAGGRPDPGGRAGWVRRRQAATALGAGRAAVRRRTCWSRRRTCPPSCPT